MVVVYGKVVFYGLDWVVKNMDNIKEIYVELSVLYFEKLYVDFDNFKVMLQELNEIGNVIYI